MKLKSILAVAMSVVTAITSSICVTVNASAKSNDLQFNFWRGPDDNSLNIDITMPGDHVEKLRSSWKKGEPSQWFIQLKNSDYVATLYGSGPELTENDGYTFSLTAPDGSEVSKSDYECYASFNEDEDLVFSLEFGEDTEFSILYPDTCSTKYKYSMLYKYFGGTDYYSPLFGNLLGTASVPINKAVSALEISDIEDQQYTGKTITPRIEVVNNYKEKWASGTIYESSSNLFEDTNYKVTYKNNTKPGIATATITGIGVYFGTETINFNILPPQTTLSVKKTSAKKTTLSWKKSTGATGYEIYRSVNGGKFKKLTTISSTKTLSKSVTTKAGKKYQYKIRPFTKTKLGTVYGEWSNIVK